MAATPPAAGLPAEVQAMINISLGGIVVSTFFSFLTMGIILTCAWTYFEKYPKDPWAFKVLVSLCMAMSIGDTVGTGLWCYDWAVAGYANPAVMGITHWAFPLEAFLLGTTSLVVQWFFAWRLWMISMKKHWWLSAIICALSTLAWCIVVWMVHILATHKLVADLQLVLPTVYVWLGGSVAADVIITCAMMYYLDLRYRSKHAQQHLPTRGRFRAIIFRTMECNVLSLIAQIVTVALFNRPEVGFYFVLTDMTLAKVYTFSLLVSLNGRHSDGTDKSTNETSKGVESHVLADRRGTRPPNTQVSIQVQQQIDTGSDNWPKDGDADDFHSDRKVKLDSMA